MNPQETQQVVAHDKKWVPSIERVKISSTKVRLETIVPQKEETFQVVTDIIKNSTCFKAFTISADVLEIFMQQFWYIIKKVKDSESYEFLLANKKCIVDAEVFRKILNICPRVKGKEFTSVQDDDDTLTFLTDLGYKEFEHEPAKKRTGSKRVVKKKITISVDDNIIPDPNVSLELGKSISIAEAKEEEEASRNTRSVVTQDTLSAPKSKPAASKPKLKGTRGSSEGTSRIPVVSDESTVISATLSKGIEEDLNNEEEIDWIDFEEDDEKKDDTDDDKIIDLEMTDNEETDDEVLQGKEQLNDDKDEEMTNAEVEESGNGDEEDIVVAGILQMQSSAYYWILRFNLTLYISTPIITLPSLSVSTIPLAPLQQSTAPIHSPGITTDASTIITAVPEFDTLSDVQLRVAKLEKDVSELKKIDHSAKALDTLKSQDENAMDKGVTNTVKDHKRKHDDDDDDDDDKDPLAGPNQSSKTDKSAFAKEPVKQPIAEVVMDDTGEDMKILGVKSVSVKKLHGYGHLEEVVVKRVYRQLCKFKEGEFVDLHLNDIEDMLLLAIQHKLFHLNKSDIVNFINTRFSIGIQQGDVKEKVDGHRQKEIEAYVELIDKQIRKRRIIKNLERFVGAWELEMDYKLMTRTVQSSGPILKSYLMNNVNM
nr:hypothetical protein [Tanacetum cinerariifolium]